VRQCQSWPIPAPAWSAAVPPADSRGRGIRHRYCRRAANSGNSGRARRNSPPAWVPTPGSPELTTSPAPKDAERNALLCFPLKHCLFTQHEDTRRPPVLPARPPVQHRAHAAGQRGANSGSSGGGCWNSPIGLAKVYGSPALATHSGESGSLWVAVFVMFHVKHGYPRERPSA